MKTRVSLGVVLVAAALSVATLAGLVAGDGNVALALGPAVVFALGYAAWRLPLRWPLLALSFAALTLENPADVPAQGLWKSPLYTAGALLLAHVNVTLPHKWMLFSGLDLVLVFLLLAIAWRTAERSPIDGPPRLAPRPLRLFAVATLAAAAWAWVYGVLRGGADVSSSLWQVERVVYLPVLFFVFQSAIRPRDTPALAKVLVGAACLKALVALWVRSHVAPPPGQTELAYATTHPDSMLFAGAACVLVALHVEHRDRKHKLLALLALPLIVAGMIANERRIVWVELAAGLLVIAALTPPSRAKLFALRAAIVASPTAILYVALGWSSGSRWFGPVHTIRTLVDSDTDGSTNWRDWENYDLVYTLRQHPLFGVGYGHGYDEYVKLPDVSTQYSLERFAPHNSILGLWAYGGIVGFTALWMVLVAGLFFGARAYRKASRRRDRAAILGATVAIVVYLVHCYGDLGLGTWVGVFTVAPALAVVGQLAVATGAWANVAPARAAPVHVRVTVQEVAP